MDKFVVSGGRPLQGTVRVNGSKNGALPILISTLLTDETCLIENVPALRDIRTTLRLLEDLGKKTSVRGKTVRVEFGRKLRTSAPYELVKQMRASILVAGPLLGRFGTAQVSLPGGCAIGLRPIDIHVQAFKSLGARTKNLGGDFLFSGELRPATVKLRFASVGATENLMMAASSVVGRIVIENAAREPEIEDLAVFLRKMGARITGEGTSRITIEGTRTLIGVRHRVLPDRIEAGTYLLACAAAGGRLRLHGAEPSHLEALIIALRKSGARIKTGSGFIEIKAPKRIKAVSIRTKIHPGFPTDLQAVWMAYMCRSRGLARVKEAIFERRFLHAAELARLGALISVAGDTATVSGVAELRGAAVMASDLRAGAALVVAALSASGVTEVHRVYHIDRGYERMERVLRKAGARIRRARA